MFENFLVVFKSNAVFVGLSSRTNSGRINSILSVDVWNDCFDALKLCEGCQTRGMELFKFLQGAGTGVNEMFDFLGIEAVDFEPIFACQTFGMRCCSLAKT